MKNASGSLLVALCASACLTALSSRVSLAQSPEQSANATASAGALTGESAVLQLAIPIDVSVNGVRVVGDAQIIRAPRPQPGAGPQLQITLEGKAPDSPFKRQYALADPRLSEVEGEGQQIAKHARMFVYVELNDWASRIHITPLLHGEFEPLASGMAFDKSAQSTIPLFDVAKKVCTGDYTSSPMCLQNRTSR